MKAKSFALYALYFWLIFFGLIPLLMMFAASFLSKDSHHLVALPFTLENYTSLFTAVFVKIFLRSLLIACITTFFVFLLPTRLVIC